MHVLGQHLKKNRQKINRCAPATTHTWNAGSGLLKSRGETKQNKRSAVKKKSKMRFVDTQTYLHRTWKCHSELKNCFFVTALSQFGAEGRCGYIPTPRVSVTPKLSGGDWGVWGAVSLLVPACIPQIGRSSKKSKKIALFDSSLQNVPPGLWIPPG